MVARQFKIIKNPPYLRVLVLAWNPHPGDPQEGGGEGGCQNQLSGGLHPGFQAVVGALREVHIQIASRYVEKNVNTKCLHHNFFFYWGRPVSFQRKYTPYIRGGMVC
jgi:hypothetical protein